MDEFKLQINKTQLRNWASEEDCYREDGGDPEFKFVDSVDRGSGRWESHHQLIILHVPTGTYWSADFRRGLTEEQDSSWFDDSADSSGMVQMDQVLPKPKLGYEWLSVKKLLVVEPKGGLSNVGR